jgi:hypothetical protein
VGGEIAGSLGPFDRRFTIGFAIGTGFVTHHPVTPLAGLNDGITSPTVVGTADLLHENAFCPYFDGLADHGALPPFSNGFFFFLNLLEMIRIYRFVNEHKKK